MLERQNGIDGKSMDMKKRESSYIRKSSMVVKGLLVLLMASQVTSVCHTDSQCPGDQVCIIETHTQKSANHKNFKVEVNIIPKIYLESPIKVLYCVLDHWEVWLCQKSYHLEVALPSKSGKTWRCLCCKSSMS